eukprot:COSAG02_NODE_720_length_18054_cov_23.121192_13_plen_216_part_00
MLITSSNRGYVEAPGTREALADPDSTYCWTRYFTSEKQREELYAKVYGSVYWTDALAPMVPECVDRDGIACVRIQATDMYAEGIGAENARRGGGFGGMSSGRGKIAGEAFYELRQYPILPGKMDAWLEFMERTIVPFQLSQGMSVTSSSTGEGPDADTYIWTRKLESEEQRTELYKLYQSEEWTESIGPRTSEFIDRANIKVWRLTPTPKWVCGV